MPARTLKPQDLISHYRIVGPLGAGGMGEVYRAQDQTLERDVALKILPAELVRSEERVRRFVLEAKSASSLSHPHIVTIYEIGQDRVRPGDGPVEPDSSPLHFISMELVSGETLTTKIHREKIDLKTLLSYLAQAAEGLSKAHAAGIVHRDLKPGNIMVSKDGYAKVLDFGLAKLTERQAPDPGLTSAPTLTEEGTGEGVVLGTVDYMSPEQVQGKPVDHRSDVFSFGSILYEAATRRRPFAADSSVETMHKILREEPESVQALNPEAPAELRRLIRRCLAKNPDQRLDSMRTLAIELREIVDEYDALSATPSPGSGTSAVGTARRAGGVRLWIALAAVAVALSIIAVSIFAQGPPRLGSHMTFRTLATPSTNISYPGLSPDGKWIAFGAADERNRWDLYLMNVNGSQVRRITADSSMDVNYVDISPDGSMLVYTSQPRLAGPQELRVVSSLGGVSGFLREGGTGARWSPDGRRIGYHVVRDVALNRQIREFRTIRADGSDDHVEFADSAVAGGRSSFAWSPDGKKVAWLRTFPGSYQEVVVRDLKTGRERQITHDRKTIDEVHWTRRNRIVFSSSRGGNINLWVIRASGGPAAQLTRGSGPDLGMCVAADDRRMIYLERQQTSLLWISPTSAAKPTCVTQEELLLGRPAISPDGRHIAVPILRDPLGNVAPLYLMNRNGSERRPLTGDDWLVEAPRWSPDGHLTFAGRAPSDPVDSFFVYVLDLRASSRPRRVTYGAAPQWLDSTSLGIMRGTQRWRVSADGSRQEPLGVDSTNVLPGPHGRYSIVFDQRPERLGSWLRIPGDGPDSAATYRKFTSGFSAFTSSRGADFIIWFLGSGRAERVSLPELHHTPIRGAFTGLDPQKSAVVLRWDAEEMVYTEPRLSSKLVLIDNLR